MREIYTKTQDGILEKIEVNFDAHEYKDECPWLFSLFIKYDGFDDTKEGFEEYLETKESLIITLEQQNAHYLGSRVIEGWSEFYFCAPNSKGLDKIAKQILSPSGYVYESNVVRDNKWDVYETQLMPNELEIAHIQSAKIIFLLKEEGDALDLPREVEHYAVFDTPTQKEKFIEFIEAAEDGFSFKDEISSEEFEHGVALVKIHSLDEDEVKQIVEDIFSHIKQHGGYYEGWSTTLLSTKES